MNYKKDYYSILEVDEKATPEVLRASYRRLAKLHHPDKNPGDPGSEERFKSINEAYEILSNEITRSIYDNYRASIKKEYQQQSADKPNDPNHHYEPFKTTKTKTYTVTREKRIYVHGIIEVKFQGDPELSDAYIRQWEQQYTIIPTEVLATITSSGIYNDSIPKEYQHGYYAIDIFATPLKQPIHCKIIAGDQVEFYQLDLYDIRVKDPVLKDITRHDKYSFGTLYGTLFGYVLHQYKEEVTEEYSEYSGSTGNIETKTESGYVFTRQQFYAADGSTYWSEWKRRPGYSGKYYKHQHVSPKKVSQLPDWSWLLILLIPGIIFPFMAYLIFPPLAMLLVILLLGWFISLFNKILPVLIVLALGYIFLFATRSSLHRSGATKRSSPKDAFDHVSTQKKVIRDQNKQADTVITHHLQWQDGDSNRYSILLSLPLSILHRSTTAHEQMDEQQYAALGISDVYQFMLNTDNSYTQHIAAGFDSLAKARSLNRLQEASMIVSCIQSIPYALIVDRSCTANYTDDYISQYLAHCEGNCCKGYSKFGVQSPVEFIGDLKGDCDTRALLLYDLLGKLGYKVALMTSNYYKHALIAVCLDKTPADTAIAIHINEQPYYLWETTSKGLGPGELPDALSNINHWNIALIQ